MQPMKLETYMEKHGISKTEMGRLLDKDRTVIGRYQRGEVMPPVDVIQKIQEITDQAVRFDDWVSQSNPQPAEPERLAS
jgi:transcriptional regulator with XRE-family HTH domain